MELKSIIPGTVKEHFVEASKQTAALEGFENMTCFFLITVTPRAEGKHNVSITCVGSQADQVGMLVALLKHAKESLTIQQDLMSEDPLAKAKNMDELEKLAQEVLQRMMTQ